MWTFSLGGITVYQLLWFFVLYSMLGWCLEVVYCSVDTGKFVNRGFLNGPLCPIYGFGGLLAVYLLVPLGDNLIVLYLASVVLASLLELVAGFILKKLFHTSWWDYSDQPFNLGGYICLKFSLFWGIGCVVMVKLIHPVVAAFVDWFPTLLGEVVLVAAYVLLLTDLVVTVAAVLKFNRDLGELTRLADGMHKGSEAMAKGLGNTALSVAGKVEDLDLPAQKEKIASKLHDGKEKVSHALHDGYEYIECVVEEGKEKLTGKAEPAAPSHRREQLLKARRIIQGRLARAFPSMKHTKYQDAYEDVCSNCSDFPDPPKKTTKKGAEKKPAALPVEHTTDNKPDTK